MKLCRCLIEAAVLDVLGAAAAVHNFLLHFEMSALKAKCLRLEFMEKPSMFCLRVISALFLRMEAADL